MNVKYKVLLPLLLIFYSVNAQEVNKHESKLSYSISILPNTTFHKGFIYNLQNFRNSDRIVKGSIGCELGLNYKIRERLSIEPIISYNNHKTQIFVQDIYSSHPRYKYMGRTFNHFIEPGINLKYLLLKKENSNISVSIGHSNSFLLAQRFSDESGKRPQTTIYQNYLQLGIEYNKSFKNKEHLGWHIGLLYKNDLVDYYNTDKYDVTAYPNVFYRNMLGVKAGVSFK